MRSWLVLALVLAAPWNPRALADEEGFEFPKLESAERVQLRHLRLQMLGQVAGGMSCQRGHLPGGRILQEVRMAVQLKRTNPGADETFRISGTEVELTEKDGRRLATRSAKLEAGVEETTECVYSDSKVRVVQQGPGGTYRHEFDLPPGFASSSQVWLALVAAWQEGTQPKRSYVSFDASNLQFEKHEATLLGRTSYEHDGEKHACWHVRDVDEKKMVTESKFGADLLPYEIRLMGGALLATWVNEPTLDAGASALTLSSMIQVDRALDRMLLLESLEVRLVLDPPPGADDPTLFEDGPYQTVAPDPAGVRLTLHAQRLPTEAQGLTLPIRSEDPAVARHLAPSAQAQSDHPEIVAQAKRIVGDAKDAASAARRIVGWVWAHIDKEGGARGSATALEVLRAKRGDCTEHAVLVVALCRAVGVPARAVSGLEYLSTEDQALAGFHAWAEAWLGRWTPVDATIPEVGTSARYVFAGYDEPGESSRSHVVAALVGRKARLEILAWKHEGSERVEAPKPEPVDAK